MLHGWLHMLLSLDLFGIEVTPISTVNKNDWQKKLEYLGSVTDCVTAMLRIDLQRLWMQDGLPGSWVIVLP